MGGRDRWAPGGSAPDSARSVFPVSRVSLSYAPCGDGTQRRSFLGWGRRAEEQAQGVSNLKVPADINLLLAHLRRSHGSAPSQQREKWTPPVMRPVSAACPTRTEKWVLPWAALCAPRIHRLKPWPPMCLNVQTGPLNS